eukprot:TRINITY_DN1991_c0_g1_i19.p1 TRINITY_DN1991_c0_g1~~TRINITY_DN1991_c0_g1_i19.p1  ORF type:complete len:496 (+),score=88.48 TRINITY_DN1991_c0_g1_i19:125-1612(+)
MSGIVSCQMCSTQMLGLQLLNHIPQCYRNRCLEARTLPLCTCNTCQGRKTHHGDVFEADFFQSQNNPTTLTSSQKLPLPNLSLSNDTTLSTKHLHTLSPYSQPKITTTTTATTSSSSTTEKSPPLSHVSTPLNSSDSFSEPLLIPDLSPIKPNNSPIITPTKVPKSSTPVHVPDAKSDNTANNNNKNNSNNNSNSNSNKNSANSNINNDNIVSTPATSNQSKPRSGTKPGGRAVKRITCLSCNSGISPSQARLPLVFIGLEEKYSFCKKEHLNNDALLNLNKKYFESIPDQPKDDQEGEFSNKCAGVDESTGLAACTVDCGTLLSCQNTEGEKLYFCEPDHLMSYIKFHNQGQRPGRKRKKPLSNSPILKQSEEVSDDDDSDYSYSFADSPPRERSDDEADNNSNTNKNSNNNRSTRLTQVNNNDSVNDNNNNNNNNSDSQRKKTAYSLFCDDNRALVKQENPDCDDSEISRLLSIKWKHAEGEKQYYKKMASLQ